MRKKFSLKGVDRKSQNKIYENKIKSRKSRFAVKWERGEQRQTQVECDKGSRVLFSCSKANYWLQNFISIRTAPLRSVISSQYFEEVSTCDDRVNSYRAYRFLITHSHSNAKKNHNKKCRFEFKRLIRLRQRIIVTIKFLFIWNNAKIYLKHLKVWENLILEIDKKKKNELNRCCCLRLKIMC